MKKKIQILAIIISAMILPCSCEPYDMVYEPPQEIYDALWNIIDRRYCFLEYAKLEFGLDWNSVYHKHRSKLDENSTDYDLFKVCGELLAELRDGHVNLTSPYGTTFYRDWALNYPINFSDSLQRNYLGNRYMLNNGIKYSILQEDIAYAHVGTFNNDFGEGNLSALLYTIGDCRALILDIRNNGGGMLTAAETLASIFTDKKIKTGYIQHKTGTGHNSFSSPEPMYLSPSDGSIWLRPVIVLT
ncbi:MAG: peptidase S41, partial [Bacteroidaceae bacterium]|nr:peptidase S41 [Bacteroidaceae bacterium]